MMKYLTIIFLVLCSHCSHRTMKLKTSIKPQQQYQTLFVTVRFVDSVRYFDDRDPLRLYKLSNDCLIWLPQNRHIFPGDTLRFIRQLH